MTTFPDVKLRYESHHIYAHVDCAYCGAELGRIEMAAEVGAGEDAVIHGKEVEGEIQLLVDEHRPLCPKQAEEIQETPAFST